MQARADRKQVVLHLSHCLSSSGNNSNASRSASVTPCEHMNIAHWEVCLMAVYGLGTAVLRFFPFIRLLPMYVSLTLTYLFQQGLAEFPLLLDNNEHFPVCGCSQVEVQLLWAGGHFAGELLMREHAVASEVSVMLNTQPPLWQLMERGGQKVRKKTTNIKHSCW